MNSAYARRAAALGVLFAVSGATGALAQSPEAFFKGKTITVTIGFSPGGTYDLFGRMVARHIGRHIPGKPTVVASNMPGAGSFRAANWLYSVAPKDGTALGIVSQTLALEQALGNKAARFKADQFSWIGRVTSNTEVHVMWHKSKGTNIEGAKTAEIPVASTGPGSPSETYPKLLNALVGTKLKLVRGYPGSTNGLLAMERGEVDGALTSWNTMKSTRQKMLDDKKMFLLVQYVLKRSPELPNVPTALELVKSDEDKKLITFAISSSEIGRAILAPPGLPADRLAALRTAFDAAMKDPALLAEVKKANLDFEPATGAEMAKIVADTVNAPAAVVEKMKKIVAAN
ncbi:MAG: Bug family tripartite tricarboxylate transporter substrate binding protein [Beijerinckiaceae bacterium]